VVVVSEAKSLNQDGVDELYPKRRSFEVILDITLGGKNKAWRKTSFTLFWKYWSWKSMTMRTMMIWHGYGHISKAIFVHSLPKRNFEKNRPF
jgi:hypothetical protein